MADRVNDGGPAFPEAIAVSPSGDVYPGMGGMSLRDYFAAKAMANLSRDQLTWNASSLAAVCYEIADAMLKAREVQP